VDRGARSAAVRSHLILKALLRAFSSAAVSLGPMDTQKVSARDAAQRRLRRVTRGAVAAAGVLALAFAGLAAKAFPGRSGGSHAVSRTAPHRAVTTTPARQTAPPLVAAESPAPPAPAQSAPTQTPAPPAVVSGGS